VGLSSLICGELAQLDPRRKAADSSGTFAQANAAQRRTFRAVNPKKEKPVATSDKESTANLPGSKTDKRKQSLYFPESMLQEIKEEAARLDRSLSWVVQRAWKISRAEIKKLPSVNDVEGAEDEEGG
jgi:uncharacterized small protein (TIGR04563 family)